MCGTVCAVCVAHRVCVCPAGVVWARWVRWQALRSVLWWESTELPQSEYPSHNSQAARLQHCGPCPTPWSRKLPTHAHTHARTHTHTHTHTHMHTHKHTRTCTHTHAHKHVHTHAQINTHAHAHAHTHKHTHTHVRRIVQQWCHFLLNWWTSRMFSSWLTCTVALGIQARAIKIFSFILKPANRTKQNVTKTRTSKPTHRVETPKPTHTHTKQVCL